MTRRVSRSEGSARWLVGRAAAARVAFARAVTGDEAAATPNVVGALMHRVAVVQPAETEPTDLFGRWAAAALWLDAAAR